jgi:hypothetical protein
MEAMWTAKVMATVLETITSSTLAALNAMAKKKPKLTFTILKTNRLQPGGSAESSKSTIAIVIQILSEIERALIPELRTLNSGPTANFLSNVSRLREICLRLRKILFWRWFF